MQSPVNYPTTAYVKAEPLQRFLAALIDNLVAYVPLFVLSFINYRLGMLGYLVWLVYFFTRDALPEMGGFLGGQSIGKKLLNIKVIREDTGQGIEGDYATAIVRQVPLVIPIFGLIDALMVLGDERKRFGDKWAKTIVIKA